MNSIYNKVCNRRIMIANQDLVNTNLQPLHLAKDNVELKRAITAKQELKSNAIKKEEIYVYFLGYKTSFV